MGFSTDAIHAGQESDPVTGAVITPLYQTSTYEQDELGKHKGYEYGRTQNKTREAVETNIATLEKGKYGVAFASGLAATHALVSLLKAGDHVVISHNVYGGTYRLYEQNLTNFGLEFSWIDTTNADNIRNSIKDNTKMVFVETPTNPMLCITDLKEVSDICKSHNLLSVCDNTFMSPYFQNPLLLGIDIVLHSSTKYLNGHSDLINGIIVTNNEKVYERIRYIQNAAGGIPSPFDCWLLLRATKTLALRMQRHNENAIAFANFLVDTKIAKKVIYPGLPNHPQHEIAKKQMSGFGGMVTADFGTLDDAKKVLNNVKIFLLAESLGGVESLVCHPASMTHAAVPKEVRDKFGLTDGVVRFSVGIEDVEDLIDDVEQAIK